MDLVVRTPHGDADVTIVRHGPSCTLGDLIAAVSGQAVPRVARVDDRTIDCATPLDAAHLLIGSTVTTDPAVPVPRQPDDVELVQIAGPGAGRSRRLSLGRYRIGPGRRLSTDELSVATVEESVFEITVATDGVVTVGATGDRRSSSVRIAGSPVRSNVAWDDGVLTVDNRAFVIDRGPPSGPRRLPPPDTDGTVPFSRPPLRPGSPPRLPAIDAVRDATAARPTLWQRRPGHPGAFVIPIGIREGPAGAAEVVEIDLFTERAVAIAGGESARTALARTVLVEATTAHSPVDLDVVIATAPDRLAEWDWAKWLPHLRVDNGPMVLATRDAIAAWAHSPADRRAQSGHLTLLVIDDPNLWRRRESPLRSLLASPPTGLRVIALCDDAGLAPALCTTLLTESPDRRWHLVSLTDDVDTDDVFGALMERAVAAEVARALAPLTDTELPPAPVIEPEAATRRRSLLRCLGDPTPDDLRRHWGDPDIDLTAVPFGADSVTLDLTSHDVVIAASDAQEADRVAVTIAVAACTRLGPSAMLLLDLSAAASSTLDDFPHTVSGAVTGVGNGIDPSRLIARLGHLLAPEDAPQFVVVVIGAATDRPLRDALLAASPDLPGLCLIVAAAGDAVVVHGNPPSTAPDHMITITVERQGDRRRAVVDTTSGPIDVHLDDDPPDDADLVLRPLVLGRPLTPLEHRIGQRSQSTPLSFTAACRDLAQRARVATDEVEHPWLIPASLPSSIDTDVLFAEWPGDAVPIGLIDIATTGQQPIWWQPDDGLLVAFGSLRSGVDDLLATVLVGVIDRIAPADAELVVVDRSPTRRPVIQTIDPRLLVVAPDEPDDLSALLEVLGRPDGQRLIVVIDDLGHLRAQAAVKGVLDRLDRGLTAARSVVAVARTADDAGPLLTVPGRHLIGSLADPDDQRRLGGSPEGPRGRCRMLETGEIVQLAALDRSLASAISERLTDPRDGAQ